MADTRYEIEGPSRIAMFLGRFGDLGVFTLVGTRAKATTKVGVGRVPYVQLASWPWELWVPVAYKEAINAQIRRARGLRRESHPTCMSTGGDLTMTACDLAEILRAAGVKNLYAVVHSLKSSSRVFLDVLPRPDAR